MADALPVIPALEPTTIPAVAEQVFDRFWMTELRIRAENPNSAVDAVISLRKARVLDTGAWELSPVDGPIYLRYENLLDSATKDPALGGIVVGLLRYVADEAVKQQRAT
jgi:hypothetical protein